MWIPRVLVANYFSGSSDTAFMEPDVQGGWYFISLNEINKDCSNEVIGAASRDGFVKLVNI